MKIKCPGCGAEIDTDTLEAEFPPSSEEGDGETGPQSQGDGDNGEQVPPVPAQPIRSRSRFLK